MSTQRRRELDPWRLRRLAPYDLVPILLLFVVLSGCVAVDGVAPASASASNPWIREATHAAVYTECDGDPFSRAPGSLTADCMPLVITVPANATRFAVTVSAPLVDASRPGAGTVQFILKQEDEGEWRRGAPGAPAESTTMEVTDPDAGEWTVWPMAYLVVVNQEVIFEATVEGIGPPPSGEFAFEERPLQGR